MRRHTWVLAAGALTLAGLLVVLGTLQYRWLDQVGETLAAQKRASLYRRGSALAADLERELSRAFQWFTLEQTPDGISASALDERWKSWREEGRHAALVADVLVLQRAGGERSLYRLDGKTLVGTDWPAGLTALRDDLGHGPGAPLRVLDGAPVLVVLSQGGPRGGMPGPGGPGAIVLVRLDRQYLTSTLLPALAEEHLGGDEPVVVQLRAGGEPIFTWPAGAPRQGLGDHDAIAISSPRPDSVDDALLAGMRPPRGQRPFGPRPGPPERFGRPPGMPGGPRASAFTLSLGYAAGRVDDLVASLKRRNAALAFGILAVLGGAIGVLVVAVRRAQALAERRHQFMASVSHELRTPLAVIASAAENLRDGTVEGGERVREYGSLIHDESKRLHAMVDDVLRLAAGTDLETSLHLEPVDVRDVVDTAVNAFQQEIRTRGGQVERSDPEEAPIVTADARALRHAVENVVGNALKYGGETPQIAVRIFRAQGPAGAEVRVAVEDHGIGIPADELDHLFDPFFRGREAMKRQIRGTGLGLSLVKRVMRAHGGGVSVESTPGRGTCFTLRLPCDSEELAS